jgi:hypothetical protein
MSRNGYIIVRLGTSTPTRSPITVLGLGVGIDLQHPMTRTSTGTQSTLSQAVTHEGYTRHMFLRPNAQSLFSMDTVATICVGL